MREAYWRYLSHTTLGNDNLYGTVLNRLNYKFLMRDEGKK